MASLSAVRWLVLLLCGTITALALSGAAEAASKAASALNVPEGQLRLIVSLDRQRIDVYRGLNIIASSPVSTGRKGYATPAGVYSVLQKAKWHRSNLYSDAPMPFMQRLTWSGIALHEGNTSRPYASHGCIRLPRAFARKLYGMTKIGVDVIITKGEAAPTPIYHPTLFQPQRLDTYALADMIVSLNASDAAIAAADAEAAIALDISQRRNQAPLRILITRRNGREKIKDLQNMLAELGHDPGEIDGLVGTKTGTAIQAFQRAHNLPATGMVSQALYANLHNAVGRPPIDGHIYVRQDYVDLFDAPVSIKDPETPLGTHVFSTDGHVFSTDGLERAGNKVVWSALTMADNQTTALDALNRIEIPALVRKRIALRLMSGASMVITDAGLGRETGKGTDFIVQPARH